MPAVSNPWCAFYFMPGSTSVQYDLQNSIEFKYTGGVTAAAEKTENWGQAAGKGQWKMQARGAG